MNANFTSRIIPQPTRILLAVLLLSHSVIKPVPHDQPADSLSVDKIMKGYKAAFVMLDNSDGKYFRYNKKRCAERYLPASTFKIPNSLIGLESGVIADENFIIKWDGIKRWNKDWNRDNTLASAIKISSVPYYQELARRVGREAYGRYFKSFNYGNNVIGDKVEEFWLDNSLKISADEQLSFLKQFYEYKLPFSKRNTDIVKKILSKEKHPRSIMKFKTGTGETDNGKYIGWLVGYVEKENNVFFFAFNVEAETFEEVRNIRDTASRKILITLKILE
ncbi:MAG: class D beta-lactamase [Melioribacteraceae bacterium]